MNFDDIRQYIVLLNGGSGCLFQPYDSDQTYILTAKHVLNHENNTVTQLKRFVLENEAYISEDIPYVLTLNVNYFEHPERDIAILKIDRINGLDKIIRTDMITVDRTEYTLAGYPALRRTPNTDPQYNNAYRTDEQVTIQGLRNNYLREAWMPDRPGLDEVRGHSGGALSKIKNGFLLLAGIQSQMVGAPDEQLGRVEFSPMSSFDDLINLFPNDLTPLVPAYLGCFSFLKDASFLLEVNAFNEPSVAYTRSYLKNETDKIIASNATPLFIKKHFEGRLLLNQEQPETLDGRNIWIAWLEFLTILNLVNYKDLGEEAIAEIFNSFRLLFSDTQEDWTSVVPNMIYSDYKGLKPGGLVVIGTNKTPLDRQYEIAPGKVINLMRAGVEKGLMKTDEGINFPFDHYRFIHLDSFKKKCILDKLNEYENIFNEAELLTKLQLEYGQYITRRED